MVYKQILKNGIEYQKRLLRKEYEHGGFTQQYYFLLGYLQGLEGALDGLKREEKRARDGGDELLLYKINK